MTSPQDPWQQQYPQAQYPPQGEVYQAPQQAGYPPNPYAAPPAPQEEMARPAVPSTLNAAFWIAAIVPALITVLGAVSMSLMIGEVGEIVAPAGGADIAPTTQNLMISIVVGTTFFYGVLSALWIFFGLRMRAGRNWARITLTVFASLWILNSLSTVSSGAMSLTMGNVRPVEIPAATMAIGYTASGIALITMSTFVVLIYLLPSNRYFQAVKYR